MGFSGHHDRSHGGFRRDHDGTPIAPPAALLPDLRGDCLANEFLFETHVLFALRLCSAAADKNRWIDFFGRGVSRTLKRYGRRVAHP